jgi:hypothetical protein
LGQRRGADVGFKANTGRKSAHLGISACSHKRSFAAHPTTPICGTYYTGGESRPPNQDLAYDLSRLSVVTHLALPEVVLFEMRGDVFEHVPCGFQLGLIVISSQVLD